MLSPSPPATPSLPAVTAVTVVIDVIRAFTTAAAAFAGGAPRVICAETVDQARVLAAARPGALLVGELWGVPPEDFDAGNSPCELLARDLRGREVVLVSQNGTPALAGAAGEPRTVLAAGLVNLAATVRWITARRASDVRIVCSDDADEDRVCADEILAALAGEPSDDRRATRRLEAAAVAHAEMWRRFHAPASVAAFERDVSACLKRDVQHFAMVAEPGRDSIVLFARRT